eukprot:764106-Hanusia_phi.AAC.5
MRGGEGEGSRGEGRVEESRGAWGKGGFPDLPAAARQEAGRGQGKRCRRSAGVRIVERGSGRRGKKRSREGEK